MNWSQVEGQWKQIKGAIQQKWGELTDDDLHVMGGNREKIVGKLQERYGYAKERAQQSVDEFIAKLSPPERDDATETRTRKSPPS